MAIWVTVNGFDVFSSALRISFLDFVNLEPFFSSLSKAISSKDLESSFTDIRLVEAMLVAYMVMDNEEISHQQSLVQDSFSTIERLESEMASITREFESLDDAKSTEEDLGQEMPEQEQDN